MTNRRTRLLRIVGAPMAIGLAALLALPLVALAGTSDAIAQTGGMTVTLPGLGSPVTVSVTLDASGNLSAVNLDPTSAGTYSAATVNGHAVSFVSADGTTQVRIKAHGSKLSVGATAGSLGALVGSGTWSAAVFGPGTTSTVNYTVGNASGTPTLSIDAVTPGAGVTSPAPAAPVTKTGKDGSSVTGTVLFTMNGFEKKLTIRVSVSAEGAKKASIKITLTGRDIQKTAGTLAQLQGSHTWSGKTCDGTAVGLTYTVNPDGTVTYVSATGGTVTLGKSEHGWGWGKGQGDHGSSASPASGFVARFDGTSLLVHVQLVKLPDGTYKLVVGYNKGCRSKTPITPPTVNTPVLPGASNQPVDHKGGNNGHGGQGDKGGDKGGNQGGTAFGGGSNGHGNHG